MSEQLPPPLRLRAMITAYWTSMALYAAAKLKLADRLAAGPRRADELAGPTGVQPRPLYRLMRALAGEGIFVEDGQGRFSLTELGQGLRSDNPSAQWALAVMNGEEHYRGWGEILYSLRTGKPAFDRIFGKPAFEYLAENPESARTFDAAMVGVHGVETPAMLDAYDFAGIGTLVDVGGGNGSLLMATLQRHPALKGILYDLPHVVERAQAGITAAGLA